MSGLTKLKDLMAKWYAIGNLPWTTYEGEISAVIADANGHGIAHCTIKPELAELIAEAVNALPFLIAEIERLREIGDDRDLMASKFNQDLAECLEGEIVKHDREIATLQAKLYAAEGIIERLTRGLERIDLDMNRVVCHCGEPYKDTDPHDLVKELLQAKRVEE